MKTRTTLILGLLAVIALAWATPARAGVIYYDDFSGAGANLHGTIPDITPTGTETWNVTTIGAGNGPWKDDGSVAGWWYDANFASLPFIPASGSVYTLSVDVYPNYSSDDWMAVAFQKQPCIIWDSTSYASMLIKPSGLVQSFLGPGLGGGQDVGTYSLPVTVAIQLDTRPTLWEFEWFINGSSVRSPEAYSANPDIQVVTVHTFWMSGTMDNFTLTPEPATLALMGLGGLGLLLRRKRR